MLMLCFFIYFLFWLITAIICIFFNFLFLQAIILLLLLIYIIVFLFMAILTLYFHRFICSDFLYIYFCHPVLFFSVFVVYVYCFLVTSMLNLVFIVLLLVWTFCIFRLFAVSSAMGLRLYSAPPCYAAPWRSRSAQRTTCLLLFDYWICQSWYILHATYYWMFVPITCWIHLLDYSSLFHVSFLAYWILGKQLEIHNTCYMIHVAGCLHLHTRCPPYYWVFDITPDTYRIHLLTYTCISYSF